MPGLLVSCEHFERISSYYRAQHDPYFCVLSVYKLLAVPYFYLLSVYKLLIDHQLAY